MIVYKQWIVRVRYKHFSGVKDEWAREGWFLFGFIPLYIRDLSPRGRT
jgi:hypothetical protein